MRRTAPSVLLLALALAASACGPPRTGEAAPGSRDVITAEEMERIGANTLYEAIERLRPAFLRPRGAVSTGELSGTPTVYIDGVRAGEVDLLRSLLVSQVQEVGYLRPRDATTRYGSGHGYGVILVSTRR